MALLSPACLVLFSTNFPQQAANARERRRMDQMNEAIVRYSFALIMPLYEVHLKYVLSRLKQSLPGSQNILSKKQTVDVVSDHNKIISFWPGTFLFIFLFVHFQALDYIVKLATALDLFK